ncbi:hypothetical protein KR059_001989 [Drosophila kikkawai]|nr:protein sisterless A [Drosophila kikkawai]KAH8330117.1 hypothetical protein KR059_001989 [Drosophila kikkawai]
MEQSHLHTQLGYSNVGNVYAPYAPAVSKAEDIEKLVDQQLLQLKVHYNEQEQNYVNQMLLANPIVVERRTSPPLNTMLPTPSPSPEAGSGSGAEGRDVQRQRAESCRKSRYNNKIKKAKLRFRHKFVSEQVKKSERMLSTMREVIAQAERQLLDRGIPAAAIERMRSSFGLGLIYPMDQ